MGKITSDELWDNFSFVVRDNRNGELAYINIREFFEHTEVVDGEEE